MPLKDRYPAAAMASSETSGCLAMNPRGFMSKFGIVDASSLPPANMMKSEAVIAKGIIP